MYSRYAQVVICVGFVSDNLKCMCVKKLKKRMRLEMFSKKKLKFSFTLLKNTYNKYTEDVENRNRER